MNTTETLKISTPTAIRRKTDASGRRRICGSRLCFLPRRTDAGGTDAGPSGRELSAGAGTANDVKEEVFLKKTIVITLGVIIGVTGVLAICAHLADAAKLALYVPEDDEDIY